ncbi:hypothetical protein GY45DRAFT_442895 [Cubamyces sp. BRFM 1775]|nr:hypothetical protein GY45DRAFT_442895 [Cubamyces sp. BRFM 1775]
MPGPMNSNTAGDNSMGPSCERMQARLLPRHPTPRRTVSEQACMRVTWPAVCFVSAQKRRYLGACCTCNLTATLHQLVVWHWLPMTSCCVYFISSLTLDKHPHLRKHVIPSAIMHCGAYQRAVEPSTRRGEALLKPTEATNTMSISVSSFGT